MMKRVLFPLIGIVAAFFVMTIGGVDNIARGQSSLPAPTGVTTDNGSNSGEANLSWPRVQGATFYRIGWMADEDYQRALAEPNGEWLKEFRYSNIMNRGQSSHTVTRLTPGIKYWFIVGSHNAFYGGPEWSPWAELTLAGDGPSCPGAGTQPGTCPSIESSQFLMSDSEYKAIDAGKNHTCGIKMDDTIECWGDNSDGQTDAPSGQFLSVSAGGVASCGINFDDNLVCWGHVRMQSPPARDYTQVSVGEEHACAVSVAAENDRGIPQNRIDCWGLASNDGRNANQINTGYSALYMSTSAGSDYNCGITARGHDVRLTCWGNNPTDYDRFSRDQEPDLVSITAGDKHLCGLLDDGRVLCHGNDVIGQVSGQPNAQNEGSPDDFYTYDAISAGGEHTCGLRTTGNIRCWGSDLRGQANPPGMNEEFNTDLQGVGDFTSVSAGGSHTCGIRDDGTAVCWGYNVHGQADPP